MISWINMSIRRCVFINPQRTGKNTTKSSKDPARYIFLTELAKLSDDRIFLRGELLGIFFGGRDTTASLLTNMFFVIARRPDLWRKLKEEVAHLDGKEPTYDQLGRMIYLRWCLNECKSVATSRRVPFNRAEHPEN